MIGERIRILREASKLSQGDTQERTGLVRCYISRVENGHTVPALETLEKFARGLKIPLYQILYDAELTPTRGFVAVKSPKKGLWGSRGKEARYLSKLRQLLSRMTPFKRSLLMLLVGQIVRQKQR
jgi:transcriptional regulator with XRE-family HTH domain